MATNSIIKRPDNSSQHQAHERAEARTQTRTWFEAYRLFLASPQESLGLKILPLALMGLVPLALADDILLPLAGLLDNIPTSLLVIFVAVRTWLRVRLYK